MILAMGIVGNVENIGLEAAGIKVDRTHVVAGKYGETGVDGVWAIGDLVGAPWLAHKAMHEGVIVAEKIAGVKGVHPLNTSNVPGCTYCWPQVAQRRPDRSQGQGNRPQDQGRHASPSSATARRSRWARPKAWSRPCSMPRPASFWART